MRSLTIGIVIAIEGFVSIAAEILCMRQISVFMGNNVLVNSLIIGVFLLSLSYGYKRGAKYSENLSGILSRNLLVSSVFVGIGLSYWFILLYFNYIEKSLGQNSFIALIAYLLTIIAPLIYCLGQTLPITMSLMNQHQRVSEIGGKVLHISALGSFFGAITTTIIFMHYIGVELTVVLNSVLLLVAVILINPRAATFLGTTLASIAISPSIYLFLSNRENSLMPRSNEYSNYLIVKNHSLADNRVGTVFVINNSPSSFVENKSLSGAAYIEKIKDILFHDFKFKDKNILVLGAGGFSLSASGDHGNNFTYVDIDPNLKKIAMANFVDNINGEFIASDARMFLRNSRDKYDVIVSDVYSNKLTVPIHLLTKEYFELMSENLADHGIAVFNMIINPFLNDKYSRKVDNTIRSVFSNCSVTTLSYMSNKSNVIYVCLKDVSLGSCDVYCDNDSSINIDSVLS